MSTSSTCNAEVPESHPIDASESVAQVCDAHEFVSLALSRRKILRANTAGDSMLGLIDVETNRRYVVEESALEAQATWHYPSR